MDQDCEIILKIDADYQMYQRTYQKFVLPLSKECDATKGNRFTNRYSYHNA